MLAQAEKKLTTSGLSVGEIGRADMRDFQTERYRLAFITNTFMHLETQADQLRCAAGDDTWPPVAFSS
jgi:hypothetical protein